MDIAPYIRELIMMHECIILPDFGGFETSYLPSRYDFEKKRMLPPGKNVVFRIDYTKGGEILENHLAEHLNIKSSEAKKIISDYVLEIKSKLQNNPETIISGVGTFRKNSFGELIFESDENQNYLADSFGLEPLPVSIEEPIQVVPKEQVKQKIHEQSAEVLIKKRGNTLTFVIVGFIIISILMTITIVLASKFDLKLFHLGDNSDEWVVLGGTIKSDSITKVIDKTIEDNTSLKNALSYAEKPASKSIEKPVLGEKINYTNFLLAGSFRSAQNASRLNKKLLEDGFKSEVLEIDGLYRVCLGKFVDKDSAITELERIRRQLNRSVMLYTKK